MKLVLQGIPIEPPFDFSKKNIEQQANDAVIAMSDVFHESPIRFSDDGLYLKYAGKIFKLSVEINFIGEVNESPVPFIKIG